eukprot:1000457_1
MDTQTKMKTVIAFASPCLLALPASYTAYKVRDASSKIRFTAGFISSGIYLQIMGKYTNPVVMDFLTTESQRINSFSWMYHHVIYYMIMSSSHTPFFGGTKYYKRHNINNIKQALIASIFPSQVYFHGEDKDSEDSNTTTRSRCLCVFQEAAKTAVYFALTKFIFDTIRERKLEGKITPYPIIHMEVLALLEALSLPLHNIPSLILGMLFSDQLVVDVPYDFTYFVTSPRAFWKRWSKPATELYRYLLYEPLGGRSNAIFATMCIFMQNAMMHVEFSKSVYGDKNVKQIRSGWFKGFGVMGIAVALQVVAENKCPKAWRDSLWWKAIWLGVFHGSMCSALWVIREYALVVNIPAICASFK